MRPLSFCILILLAIMVASLGAASLARAGLAPYTDPGKIDFDQAMALLNPYGTWKQVGDRWSWTPLNHAAPYSSGRWVYSEYGWLWQGAGPTSWITEHYGYWKRGSDKIWAWYPGPVWLPQTVEIRSSPDGIGWRSGEVDRDGNFVEPPSERFTQVDEWFFVTPAQFAGPITAASAAQGATAERMLEESGESQHSYLTYRQIDRPGPHPADFINLGDGRMFAPMADQERQAVLHVKGPATAPGGDDPPDDPRQVKYWVTMDLPNRWAPPPVEAKLNELYLYRPDFYQDDDGIARRIAFWLHPGLHEASTFHLQDVLSHQPASSAGDAAGDSAAEGASDRALSSPFEAKFHPGAAVKPPPPASPVSQAGAPTNAPSAIAPAPAGRAR